MKKQLHLSKIWKLILKREKTCSRDDMEISFWMVRRAFGIRSIVKDRRARSAVVGTHACAIARARAWYACAWAACRYACKPQDRAGRRTFPGNARNSDCARSTRPYRTTSTASSRRCYSVSQIFAISANFSALQQQKPQGQRKPDENASPRHLSISGFLFSIFFSLFFLFFFVFSLQFEFRFCFAFSPPPACARVRVRLHVNSQEVDTVPIY